MDDEADRERIRRGLMRFLAANPVSSTSIDGVAAEANVTTSRFQSLYGTLGWAISDTFFQRYRPLQDESEANLQSIGREPSQALRVEACLADHFRKLGRLTTDDDNVHLVRALVRAYGLSTLGVEGQTSNVLVSVARFAQHSIDRLLSMDPIKYDRLLVKRLGEIWTLNVLETCLNYPADQVETAVQRLVARI